MAYSLHDKVSNTVDPWDIIAKKRDTVVSLTEEIIEGLEVTEEMDLDHDLTAIVEGLRGVVKKTRGNQEDTSTFGVREHGTTLGMFGTFWSTICRKFFS